LLEKNNFRFFGKTLLPRTPYLIYAPAQYEFSIMSQDQKQANDNSLVSFLKENEYLFTILGVFLVLAFIFNSPQFTSFVDPKSQSTDIELQIYCTNNGTELLSKTEDSATNTQLNCTGVTKTKMDIGNGSNFYSNTSKTFSFLCLLLGMIIYFIICYNLFLAIRQCASKVAATFKEPLSMKKMTHECMILFIVPFFYQGALWYFALLLNIFPDMMTNAVFSVLSTVLIIEFFALMGVSSELDRIVQNSRKKTLVLSIIFFIAGIGMIIFAVIQTDLTTLLILGMFGVISIGYGFKGIIRYMHKRNNIEVYEVI
jgi:hypothetical protein